MFVKELSVPMEILHYQALLNRLQVNHPQRNKIESDFAKLLAGYRGEKNLRYHLNFLPEDEYQILLDLRLSVNNINFQIDCLLISPYFLLIIESKNIAGTLIFDSNSEQCLRIYNEKEEGFPNPILQAARHRLLLQKWLSYNKFGPIPIEYFVSIAFPTSIIKSTNNDSSIYDKVLQAESAIHKIVNIKQKYNKECMNSNQLKSLSKMLLQKHLQPELDILKKLGIAKTDLIAGVKCSTCPSIMQRKHGTWYCQRCQFYSKIAHEQTILDYFLLFGPKLTNKEFREYTLLSDRKTADYLLSKTNLLSTKKGNKNVYSPPSTNWYFNNLQIKKIL
ncbi:nuclease-related domain-containing protein [Bacillus sp. FJAT-49736]|uniref:nuclease-related domain-containing protein n=1 Tax=Bacillus sp. FJAT-49736 TaxID=2833582 RepID=UPI001BC9B060|nr:nuclease-related domain-containing protein [Bacillus sp. FJAT-49736]MBS4174637.1 NERD domain-containing protein [Bacillus sp. FJAT-49736]